MDAKFKEYMLTDINELEHHIENVEQHLSMCKEIFKLRNKYGEYSISQIEKKQKREAKRLKKSDENQNCDVSNSNENSNEISLENQQEN